MQRSTYIIAALILVLCACNFNVAFKVETSDISKIAKKPKKVAFLEATIQMDYSESNAESTKDFIKKYFRDAENFRIEEAEMGEDYVADYSMLLKHEEKMFEEGEQDLFTLIVKNDGELDWLGIHLNKALFDKMNADAQAEYFVEFELAECEISFDMKVSDKTYVSSHWTAVHVNGIPAPLGKTKNLSRGQTVSVSLSSLLREAIELEEEVLYFCKLKKG